MNPRLALEDPARFAAAIRKFDEANSQDPNQARDGDKLVPRELAYAGWLSGWVLRLEPNASEPLRLAARSAHLRRWTIPRNSFPATRPGYLKWRQELKLFHAHEAARILEQTGYGSEVINRVTGLISKSAFPSDPDSRVLEDALCLVFLEHQLTDLAQKSTEEQIINALRKSWKKMSPKAHEMARQLQFGPREQKLLEAALQNPAESPPVEKDRPLPDTKQKRGL